MILNWNPEVIVNFIVSFIGLAASIITSITPKKKKIISLFYIRLAIMLMCIFMLVDGLSILFLSEILARIDGMILFPLCIFIIIGVNYTIKETIYSTELIIIFGLGILLLYTGILPGAVTVDIERGFVRMNWVGIFGVIGMIFSGIALYYLFYWGIKTWYNCPILIKKDATLFFIGIVITSIGGMVFYILHLIEPLLILVSDFAIVIGLIIFLIAIVREPKLLYILPFTIHRILVKDREGYPLYDHDWSESNISETIFTGFLNAVQLMSEEVMDIGGILNINLKEGILILRESEKITVGLIASKTSKLLKDSVLKFTSDFELKFKKELKNSLKDMSRYESAYELIEKYFSNFPYKIIKDKKHPIMLTGKFAKIPLELENKLKNIFADEKEYEAIKTELLKSPISLFSEFFNLYSELKDEIEKISEEEIKKLKPKQEENE